MVLFNFHLTDLEIKDKKASLFPCGMRVPKATISSQLGNLLSSTDLHALQIAPDQVVLYRKGSMYFPNGLSDPTYSLIKTSNYSLLSSA